MYLLHRNSFYFPNRSTLIRLSFPTLDDKKSEYYPLPAGPTLPVDFDRSDSQRTRKSLSFLWASLRAPSAVEREGDTFGCADLLAISLSTFSRFTTII